MPVASAAVDTAAVRKRISRRQFLKRAGIGAGVAVGAGVGAIPLARSRYDAKYPIIPENNADLPPNGKSVIIMGGGLAGLQAGGELAARGFRVQILEKTGTPGGKLKSWRDKSSGSIICSKSWRGRRHILYFL